MEYDTKENEQSALLLLPPDSEMDPEGIKALKNAKYFRSKWKSFIR